ncbi:MAG: rhomboid family intramembrane serine protease [Candidatus Eisenbacteria bacterium]|nr:rhomboid family intramembrane serine protease [Candidatus Eisenbacteria bacterium]
MYYFYYLPVGTEVKLKRTPYVTLGLVGFNSLIFVLSTFVPAFREDASLFAHFPYFPSVITAFSATFIHGNVLHLGLNMFYLFLFGSCVEDSIGRSRYLVSFLVCGAISTLVQSAVAVKLGENPNFRIIGASGAVAGVMGMFVVRFYYLRVKLLSLSMLFLQGVVRGAAHYMNSVAAILMWALIQLAYGLATAGGEGTRVAYWAHLSGLLMGIALALMFDMRRAASNQVKLIRGNRYFDKGKWYAAIGEYMTYTSLVPGDAEGRLQLARALAITGEKRSAQEEYEKAMSTLLKDGECEPAVECYKEMARQVRGSCPRPSAQLALAECSEKIGRIKDAAEILEGFIRYYPDHPRRGAALAKYGELLASLGKYGEAVRAFDDALRCELSDGLKRDVMRRRDSLAAMASGS